MCSCCVLHWANSGYRWQSDRYDSVQRLSSRPVSETVTLYHCIDSNCNYTKAATNYSYAKAATNYNYTKAATNYNYTKAATNYNYTKAATNYNYTKAATTNYSFACYILFSGMS